jgi:hypothetical protein
MVGIVALGAIALLGLGGASDPQYWDTVISGVTLEDPVSGRAFIMRHPTAADEPADDFPQFRCLNADGTEVLYFILQYGAERYQFAQFRVRSASSVAVKSEKSSIPSFVSGKGVRLGLTIDRVVQLLGPGVRQERQGEVSLKYSCSSAEACPGLRRVNMPGYEAIYTFRAGKLVAFEGGYPYP